MRFFAAFIFVSGAYSLASAQPYTISTLAGGPQPVNISGPSASLYDGQVVAVGQSGDIFFVAGNSVIRWEHSTGVLRLFAGNGTQGFSGDNGPAVDAQLFNPQGLAVDSAGNIYIADTYNQRIRKVSNGVITTMAGTGVQGFGGDNGPATSANLAQPAGIGVDVAGNVYVADIVNSRIRRISNGVITTVAGNGKSGSIGDGGPATNAEFEFPAGLAVDSAGNVFVADRGAQCIREISGGIITTVAGNGVSGFAGDGGPAIAAELSYPWNVAVDSSGALYISDSFNNRIRKVAQGIITSVAGNGNEGFSGDGGLATNASVGPTGVAADSAGNLYIVDNGNRRIRQVVNGIISTIAGNGVLGFSGDGGPAIDAQVNPRAVTVDSSGNVYIADTDNSRIREVSDGLISTEAFSTELSLPSDIAVDSAGNIYIADTTANCIREISRGVITTVAGSGVQGFSGDGGPATNAELNLPLALAVDAKGNLYIDDYNNNRIRVVSGGIITTIAGNGTQGFSGDGGPAIDAQLQAPFGLAADSTGALYIADTNNNRIRKVSNGIITTIVGGVQGFAGDNGPAVNARLELPQGIALDSAGNLFIADTYNNRIRRVSNGIITTIAGGGTAFGDNSPSTQAQFSSPERVAVDSAGNVYIADTGDSRIRILTPGIPPTITPGGIVPVYSSVPTVEPGSWISIYGTNLASGTFLWNNDFPQSLGGTTVKIDNKLAYLWVVSPNQINLQVPDDATTGLVSVVVTTGYGTATSTVTLSPYGPSFSLLGDGKHVAGEILTPSGYDLVGPSSTFSYSTRPVKPGETLVLYGVGFGPTTTFVPAGQSFSGSAPTSDKVAITIGGLAANVSYSGITEEGLFQFNLTVPNAPSGDQPLQATVNGVQTPIGPVVTIQ